MKLIFCADEYHSYLKLVLTFLMDVARYVKSTQNNKYVVSLQYLKRELSYEVDVLHVDKPESLLQVDTIIFDGFGQAC